MQVQSSHGKPVVYCLSNMEVEVQLGQHDKFGVLTFIDCLDIMVLMKKDLKLLQHTKILKRIICNCMNNVVLTT